ncbi:MAG: hypothetical protein ACXWOL_18130 [Ktedonobacteraceae bacterium]
MYDGMDENGRPIPTIRRATRRASQTTTPLRVAQNTDPLPVKRIVVRNTRKLTHTTQALHHKRQVPMWMIVLCMLALSIIVVKGAWVIVSHQSLVSLVFLQEVNQAQLKQQAQPLTPSERVNVHHQANRAEYNNGTPEWQVWSYSACSGCALAALMDSYGAQKDGKPLNCGDVLEVEYKLGVYDPGTTPTNSRGLLPPGQIGLDKTAAYFGFASDYSKNVSLDDLIAMANSGTPSIISIPTHVMIITGGDSKYVKLADSGGLRLTTVTREQFLHGLPGTRLYAGEAWIPGWYFTLKPN